MRSARDFNKQFINKLIKFMEQNSQMTPEQSLRIINETLNNSRLAIIKSGGNYFILWGCILFAVAVAVFTLWGRTGSPAWNFLWFLIPAVGYPLAALMGKKSEKIPRSFVGNMLGWSWSVFGAFSVILSVCAILWAPMNLTLVIIILFGSAEAISGTILKNWPVIIAGFLTGIIGAIVAVKLQSDYHQVIVFIVAGIILALTGVLLKFIKK